MLDHSAKGLLRFRAAFFLSLLLFLIVFLPCGVHAR